MNTLPPELIREIYTKMDNRSAYKFRTTCRDYNRVFLENPSIIPRFDSKLAIIFNGEDIQVVFRIPKFRYDSTHFSQMPEYHNVHILQCSAAENVLSESLKWLLLKNKVTELTAIDPMEAMIAAVVSLKSTFRFTEFTCYTEKDFSQAAIDDRIISMLVDHLALDVVDRLCFRDVDFRFTNIENWYKLLTTTNTKDLTIEFCRLHSHHLFSKDVVMSGMKNVSFVTLQHNTSDDFDNVGMTYLLRRDTFEHLTLQAIDCNEIIDKVEKYLRGDFFVNSLMVGIMNAQRGRLAQYLSRIADHPLEDYPEYGITTRKGNRKAKISIRGRSHTDFYIYMKEQ